MNTYTNKLKIIFMAFIVLFLTGTTTDTYARSFRGARHINVPGGKAALQPSEKLPSDIKLPEFDDATVRDAVNSLADAWNSPGLVKYLDPGFYDRDRLLDTISSEAPHDARLRILSIRNIRKLDTSIHTRPEEKILERISRVSTVVETQVEFNDPATGFQRLSGTIEMIFNVSETFQIEAR